MANIQDSDSRRNKAKKRFRITPFPAPSPDLLDMLKKEIANLKETLVRIDKDDTQAADSITESSRRICMQLQKLSDRPRNRFISCCWPLSDLLSVRRLTRCEIPCDLLEYLVNQLNFMTTELCIDGIDTQKPLFNAVNQHHYGAIRLLVKHNSKNFKHSYKQLPIEYFVKMYTNKPTDKYIYKFFNDRLLNSLLPPQVSGTDVFRLIER